ncbi:alginate export family protein [Tenacibaculum maritimum]|uniref:alginate export family protein n=1 Tax=Tenacibaculum maritimum TaxID=107401 RepID=UPI003876F80D
MKITKIITVVLMLICVNMYGQLEIDAELRPRVEYRHGYKTLFSDSDNAAMFVSQRTRLKTMYKKEKLIFYVSLQDVRVWGDTPQLNAKDKNGLGLHQVWAELLLHKNFSLKLGRQEIDYDDSRIFGNVNWLQQARSHDLALFKYEKERFKFDLGLGFNQDEEKVVGTNLKTNTYKAIQYAWLHKDWNGFSGSLLFLNNGLQSSNGLKYSQTVGAHLNIDSNYFDIATNLYYQLGKDVLDRKLNAYLLGLEASYRVGVKGKIGLGAELQSGNNSNTSVENNNAFTPFYGTNHKFNGLMDYFYVGNHINNVGLLDVYLKGNFKLCNQSSLAIAVHNFSAAEKLSDDTAKQLGTEIDLIYDYKFTKDVVVKVGYSQMLAAKGMEILKGSSYDNVNNWVWAMVTVKPRLFSTK